MSHIQLLFVIGVTLSSCTAAGSQATDTGALPASLHARLPNERLQIVTSIRGLPLGVRDGLQELFGSSSLDIADPGAGFQATGAKVNSALPLRRMVAAACAMDLCLVHYERGGGSHTWHVALFHWTPDATRFEWGGTAPGGLATIDEVRNAILSGDIKSSAGPW